MKCLRLAVAGLCAAVLGACGREPTGTTFTLTTVLSPGVAGTPLLGEGSYGAGAAAPYSFQTSTGYRNLRVDVDGVVVGASGTVTMSGDHLLVATADTATSVEPGDTAFARLYRELLSASNPMVVYRDMLTEAERLADQVGPAEAADHLETVAALTYDPVSDAASVWRANKVIGDSLETHDQATSGQVLQRPITTANGAAASLPLLFLYVNGIWTQPFDWAFTYKTTLPPLVRDAGFDPALYPVQGFYNASALYQSPGYGEMFVCERLKAKLWSLRHFAYVRQLGRCASAHLGDLAESLAQMLLPAVPKPDALRLASRVSSELNAGRGVVLVAHSQGNLIAQQALLELRETVNLGCVGVVGIAPPTSTGWPVGESSVSQLIIQGRPSRDVMLLIPGLHRAGEDPHSLAASVENDLSREYDQLLDEHFYPFELAFYAYAIDLHSINSSYLRYWDTRQDIRDRLVEQARRVSEGCSFETIAGTYTGPVDETSDGLRLIAVFTFNITQAGGILGGDYSISGTIGAESVTGTGTLSGTIGVGTNPEVNLTSTSDVCPDFSNQFRGTYDGAQRVITLAGTVHIFRINTCVLIAAYPNTVITFTP